MTKRKDTKIVSLADEAQFERLLYEASRAGGWLFATTESDVAREERRQEEAEPIDIPDELADPEKVWQRAQRPVTANQFAPKISEEVAENLARAARGGNPIPKEIEERMHRDRENAEENSGR